MPRMQKAVHRDFTVVHNGFLKDPKLSLQGRGLLVTMMSKPEYTSDGTPWNFTIRGLASELKEGKAAIATILNELEERGYLMRDTITDEKGRFVDILYTFSDEVMPEAIEKYRRKHPEKFSENDDPPLSADPCPENRDTDNQYPVIPDADNSDNNNIKKNKISKEKILSDEISINPSVQPATNEQPAASTIDRIDRSSEQKSAERLMTEGYIKGQIEYEWYEEFFEETPNNSSDRNENTTFAANIGEVDMLVAIIVSVICSNKEYIRIGGQEIPHSIVKSQFMKLEQKHIEYVLKCLMLSTKDIRNPTAYITTALYNATLTCDFAENNELKNLDPAMFIPEQYHDEAFRDRHYEHTAFCPTMQRR